MDEIDQPPSPGEALEKNVALLREYLSPAEAAEAEQLLRRMAEEKQQPARY